MPSIAMCSVRGIGVAVIVNTGTSFLSFLIRSFVDHAEAMFLVDHQQAQPRELHIARQQPMRPDDDVDFAGGGFLDDGFIFLMAAKPRNHLDPHR
jgi:hypothetical protein